jgi:hypothetical protein
MCDADSGRCSVFCHTQCTYAAQNPQRCHFLLLICRTQSVCIKKRLAAARFWTSQSTCSAEKSRRRRRSSMLGRIPRALAAAALRLNVYPFSLQPESTQTSAHMSMLGGTACQRPVQDSLSGLAGCIWFVCFPLSHSSEPGLSQDSGTSNCAPAKGLPAPVAADAAAATAAWQGTAAVWLE